MHTTSIQCPSCNRNICIALKPPLCSSHPLELQYSNLPSYPKEHTIQDLLYVHEELVKENKFFREKIDDLKDQLYGKNV